MLKKNFILKYELFPITLLVIRRASACWIPRVKQCFTPRGVYILSRALSSRKIKAANNSPSATPTYMKDLFFFAIPNARDITPAMRTERIIMPIKFDYRGV